MTACILHFTRLTCRLDRLGYPTDVEGFRDRSARRHLVDAIGIRNVARRWRGGVDITIVCSVDFRFEVRPNTDAAAGPETFAPHIL